MNEEQEALRQRMIAWKALHNLTIAQASDAVWCTDEAWMEWEDGSPISIPWAKQIEETISKPYKRREIPNAVYR